MKSATFVLIWAAACLMAARSPAGAQGAPDQAPSTAGALKTVEVPFTSHDGHPMLGKLTTPGTPGPHAVVLYVQTAEAQSVDTRIQSPRGGTLDFFDIYRREFGARNVAFFSYEGRGARLGDQPPRYVQLDRPVYNTSTLENKVRDAITAVGVLRKQPGIDASRIFLHGVSEGTLLAAEAGARIPKEVKGLILSSVLTDMKAAMKFMMSDGTFMQHQGYWDANRDGTITQAEFDADPRGIRKLMPAGFELKQFDSSGDGIYTIEDARIRTRPLVDAVDAQNLELVGAWLKAAAAVDTPDGWLADHFKHAAIDSFLSGLDMPVGFFHGDADHLTPAAELRALERRLKAAGKSNMEFQYFPGLDHGLGGLDYFMRGTSSAGYRAMFDFVASHAAAK